MNNSIAASTLNSARQLREEIKQDALKTAHLFDSLDSSIEQSGTSLQSLKSDKALPPAASIPFAPAKKRLTKEWLNKLYVSHKSRFEKSRFKGITAAKRLPTDKYANWIAERGIDVNACWSECLTFPLPEELLAFWRSQGSPCLSTTKK